MLRPFTLNLALYQAAKITESDGAFTIEPMRFLYPSQAKREREARFPQMCHHVCGHRSKREARQ